MQGSERSLVLESLFELAYARYLVRFRPFETWNNRMGKATATPQGAERPEPVDPNIQAKAAAMGRILRKVARNVPFKANCLPQASAAQIMLRRRGITCGKVFIGAKKGTKDDPLDLHAWSFVGTVCVTGDDGPGYLGAFKPLIMYALEDGDDG